MRNTRTSGFTLIELLIVVAIIAILAAIAVPNFLEAQTRAKVSRVHSDLRTLATAIEPYSVDNNNKPLLSFLEWQNAHGVAHHQRYYCYQQLTTPVSYMSSFLSDPFGKFPKGSSGVTNREEMKFYFLDTFIWSPYQPSGFKSINEINLSKGFVWDVYSVGPQGVEDPPWIPYMLADPKGTNALQNVYDSTNGTMSRGKIYRTNKGIVDGSTFAE